MIFYKIETRKTKTAEVEQNCEKQRCRECSDTLYQSFEEKAFIAVTDISDFTCELIAAVKPEVAHKYNAEIFVAEFNRASGLELSVKRCSEISLRQFKFYLRDAEKYGYIEDKDKILSDMDLGCDIGYREFLAKDIDREQTEELAREILYDKTMKTEVDRIYQIKNTSDKLCHPVHYIVHSDNEDDYRDIIDGLLSALYENNRLFSKRYSELEVHSRMDSSRANLRRLYSIQRGGTVVFKVEPSRGGDSAFETDGLCEHIERISKVINRYNQDVLTVFVLPQVCEKEADAIYKNTESIFVEISPENASGERAKEYLNYKARKAKVAVTDTLYKGIDEQKTLSSSELSEYFSIWYSNHIRTELYPQYADLRHKKTYEVKEHFGKALKELDEMIGLDNAKKMVHNALDYYKVQKMYKQYGKKTEKPSMHMVFTGNPGTAKTTVARLFAQVLKDNDVITNGRLVEVGRADLIGKYVGHTAPLVRQAFEKAAGGVLFIDEAYSLLDSKSGMYGDEAINTIVQEMENRRNETIVIFAGYPNEMEEFLSRNPGLKSRIAFHIPFDDYSPEELVEITKLMAKNRDNIIDESALEKLSGIYNDAVKISDFGNGRYARNIIEKAEMNRASRLARLNFEDVTEDMLETLVSEDFEADKKQIKEEKRIGFLSQKMR